MILYGISRKSENKIMDWKQTKDVNCYRVCRFSCLLQLIEEISRIWGPRTILVMNPLVHLNPIIFCFPFSYNLESLSLSLYTHTHTQVEANADFLKMIAFASHFGILLIRLEYQLTCFWTCKLYVFSLNFLWCRFLYKIWLWNGFGVMR